MAIKLLTRDLERKWAEFVENSAGASLYHTLEWKEVARAFGHEAIYLVSTEDTTGELNGILPLYYVKGLFGRRMVSVSLRDRGGAVSNDQQVVSALLRHAIDLTKERSCNYLELKNIGDLPAGISEELGLEQRQFLVRTQIKINTDKKKMWRSLKQRYTINKSEREGVKVRWSTDKGATDEFYRLFAATRHRLGVPVFSYEFFDSIRKNFMPRGWANCVLAEYDNKAIAGIMLFAYKDVLIEAYAASDWRFQNLRPNDLLMWNVMCWGADNGFEVYDLGCGSPNNKGLMRFQSKWGGARSDEPYYYYFYKKRYTPDMDGANQHGLIRRAWKALPLGVTKRIGPFLANQAS